MKRLTVTELNNQIKSVVANYFNIVEIEGEVSQATYHNSGHLYFSLKDENSVINCIMWRSNLSKLKFKVEKGMKVILYGALNVYTPRGEYKLIANNILINGIGDLQVAYEQLKKELQEKGYFNKKREIKKFPKRVAIITSIPSAALSDMLKIASHRWPLVEFHLYNSLVQGEKAKFDIAKKIKLADSQNYDVIVIARGGGSLEDLWSFNTREVADAIFQAKTPIISAVGHEVDYLISDFVADMRASTPSNAMELLLPDKNEHLLLLDEIRNKLNSKIEQLLDRKEKELSTLKEMFQLNSIESKIELKKEELQNLQRSFNSTIENFIERKFLQLPDKRQFQNSIETILLKAENSLKEADSDKFQYKIENLLSQKEQQLKNLKEMFEHLNPKNRERDGIAEIVKNGKKVKLETLKVGDIVELSNTQKRVEVEVKRELS